jgi:hypothetical protein
VAQVPDAGEAGTSNSGSDAGATGPSDGGGCSLSVTVTTVTDNGSFSPRNIGAIWIATGTGVFVKTLALWAANRTSHLTLWGSMTAAANLPRNAVDAITSATLSMHETHQVSWNCTNTSEKVVADGPYRVYFEMTDKNASGPNDFVAFTKGPAPESLMPPDAPYFKGISVVFVP